MGARWRRKMVRLLKLCASVSQAAPSRSSNPFRSFGWSAGGIRYILSSREFPAKQNEEGSQMLGGQSFRQWQLCWLLYCCPRRHDAKLPRFRAVAIICARMFFLRGGLQHDINENKGRC